MTRLLPSAFVLLTFMVAYLFLFMAASPVLVDPDVPWHLAAGELIRASGLPAHDPWSFTAGAQPWYNLSWPWDALISLVEAIGGLKLLFFFTVVWTAAIVALLAYFLCKRANAGNDAIILTLLLAAMTLMEFVTARPHLAGYVYALTCHYLLHISRSQERSYVLVWILLLMLLWVNTHGSFMVGFTLLGAYGLEALAHKRWAWFKQLFGIGLACLLTLALTPYGITGMYAAIMKAFDSNATRFTQEWLPFVFGSSTGISAWLLVFILASNLREKTIPLADKIISMLWLLGMLFSLRNAAFFMLLSAPYLAISLQKVVEHLDHIRTKRTDVMVALDKPYMAQKLLVITLVLMMGTWQVGHVLRNKDYVDDPKTSPLPAITYMRTHYAGKYFLTDYNMGGRIVYETRGAVPVFVDGRAGTAYSEEVLKDYMTFMFLEKNWVSLIDKYKLEGIFIKNTSNFALAYERGEYQDKWKQVYKDDIARIYVRRK